VRPPLAPSAPALPARPGEALRRRLRAVFERYETDRNELGRRLLHGTGAFVLVYYLLPARLAGVLSKETALLLALAVVLAVEVLRLGFGARLPTIRGYEAHRPASYVFYAVGLVAAVLLFPPPIAAAVVLGTAFVDPLAGLLRRGSHPRLAPGLPIVVYTALAALALGAVGRWPWDLALGCGALAAVVAVAVERWRFRWLDDDLTMTVVPAVVLYGVGVVGLGLAR